ncbi:MAG: signal peptidase II [Acidimicrobiales bacterium]|nr:signal peptidase II [Actinomycetota bacterium]
MASPSREPGSRPFPTRRCAWPARAEGCRVAERDGEAEALTTVRRGTGLLLAVAAGVLILDQLTKAWALAALEDGPIDLIGSVQLNLIRNTAGAFGLGGAFIPFLALAALGLVIYLAASGATARRPVLSVAVGLVLGGALGNLADRVFRDPGLLRGAVVDFVDLKVWPVFNVADAAITCGCAVLLVAGWRSQE